MKKLIIISVFLILISLIGCTDKDAEAKPVMNIDFITNSDGETVKLQNGEAQEFFNVTENEPQNVGITVRKESGELHIKITNAADESIVVYEGHVFPAEEFTVNVKAAGRYRIFVSCESFVGEYNFDYNLNIGN